MLYIARKYFLCLLCPCGESNIHADMWGVLQSLSGSWLLRSTVLVLAPSLTITSEKKIQRNLFLFSFTFLYINKLEFCPFLEFGKAVFGAIITTTVASLTNTTIMSRKQELPKQFFRVLGVVGNVCGYGISSILDQTSCSAIQ